MKVINKNNDIIHTNNIFQELKQFFEENKHEKIFLLTDGNCFNHCLPTIKDALPSNSEIFKIKAGEKYKSIETLQLIWNFLFENKADRNSLLINLGGGVITDIGGFAASTFKRGVSFINIPTSLLAQVDASVGGKTGINYQGLKNEIGVINKARKVIISSEFLTTLEQSEFLSGYAEMIKHALIFDKNHFEELKTFYLNDFADGKIEKIHDLIIKSVKIKKHFIKNDINDRGIRQTLNFGHTFGHAFESFFNEEGNKQKIKHGEAVAFGMLCELYISVKKIGFSMNDLLMISKFIYKIFGKLTIENEIFEKLYRYMLHDKKNNSGEINCILLKETGYAVINNKISKDEIMNALVFLNKN